jgi:hypothetical protein
MNLYTLEAVERFISQKLAPAGYDVRQLPGSLLDSYICVAPAPRKYHFIFSEVYLSEWSSGIKMRRYSKLPKWAEKKIAEQDAENA